MNQLFIKVVNLGISASWLIPVVLILRFLLKKSLKWVNVLLWGMVAVRLICPISFESKVSLVPSAETIPLNIDMKMESTINSGIDSINNIVNPVLSQNFTPQPATSVNSLQIWIFLASVVWLIGMTIMLLYATISYLRLRHRIAAAVIYRDNIYQSENVATPFVLGIIRPRIYLPFHAEGERLEYVVAHEQAHISRKDHWWKPLGFLLLTIHWFNPLMWLAYVLLCHDIELACDEKVIRKLDHVQRADYTQALVACSVNRRMIVACPLSFGEVGVKERVKSVMNYKQPAFWVILASMVACLVVGICFLTNPPAKKTMHSGLNARIIGIDKENRIFYVSDIDKSKAIFGEKCALDCRKAVQDDALIYVNYDAENDVRNLLFDDFEIGDTIVITLNDEQKQLAFNHTAIAEQIQLGTQRMNGSEESGLTEEQQSGISPENEAIQAYTALLSGNQTLVNNDTIQWWIPDFRSAGIMEYEYTYMDLDGDGTVELLVQMVNEPTSYNGVFHYEAGQLYCWNSDASEMSCRDYPLVDGTMVRQYDNSGNTSHTIFRYSDKGEKVDIHHLFAREELMYEDSTDPYPYYEVDGEEVSKDIYEERLKEQITDKILGREAWIRN